MVKPNSKIWKIRKKKRECSCCGFFTITQITQLCPICFWEENSYQENFTDDCGGPNLVSLQQAKENFKLFGAIEERFIKYIRLPNKDDEVSK